MLVASLKVRLQSRLGKMFLSDEVFVRTGALAVDRQAPLSPALGAWVLCSAGLACLGQHPVAAVLVGAAGVGAAAAIVEGLARLDVALSDVDQVELAPGGARERDGPVEQPVVVIVVEVEADGGAHGDPHPERRARE